MQSEPSYAMAFARTMPASIGNVGFWAFHSADGIDHNVSSWHELTVRVGRGSTSGHGIISKCFLALGS